MTRSALFATAVTVYLTACLTAYAQTGTLKDVEHVVIFMQENRAFDFYYASLRGIRGFNDRAAVPLPNGKPVWYQPASTKDDSFLLPYHMDFLNTSGVCSGAPEMNYPTDIAMWNNGLLDAWNTARSPGYGMAYLERQDMPYYYALADEFTIGDQYFQSTFTQTNPNRLHLFSGSNGLSVGQEPVLDNEEPGFNWTTLGEVLEDAGISWKVYQQLDNFDDNAFAWFKQYREAKPGSPLYDKGMKRSLDLVDEFKNDIVNGTLPQVSILIAPTALSEHATNMPPCGEELTSKLIGALNDNPELYAKTAFILNYDEGGQFFDHAWTPTPPTSAFDGKSTVTTKGEITSFGKPIGLGFRVPLFVVSPWTRGGFVNSEVFDHTSVLKFLEKRFGIHVPTISPWRRAVTGDLLSVFDFANPDYSWPTLPDTSAYCPDATSDCKNDPAPPKPANRTMPKQEPGVRPSRALPYEFQVSGSLNTTTSVFTLTINNTGGAGAVFYVYDKEYPQTAPRKYTVEAGKALTDDWKLSFAHGRYAVELFGPNGFMRSFAGNSGHMLRAQANPEVTLRYDVESRGVFLQLNNTGSKPCVFLVDAGVYFKDHLREAKVEVAPGSMSEKYWPIASSGNWYDFSIGADVDSSPMFLRRFAGRMETGEHSISDPAMA